MRIETASVVISLNGRDEGKLFLVVGVENGYSLLADGKGRKIEKPKRKKNKHLRLDGKINDKIAKKLHEDGKLTNNEIRKALGEYAATPATTMQGGGSAPAGAQGTPPTPTTTVKEV